MLIAVVNTLDENAFNRAQQAINRGLEEEFGDDYILVKGIFAVTTPLSRKQPPFLKKSRPEQYKRWQELARRAKEQPTRGAILDVGTK